MGREDIIVAKSEDFALRIVNLYKYLCDEREYVLSKQLLRSGTSIGANISEAEYAFSKQDFYFKMSIALKETNETLFWLRLIHKSKLIEENAFFSIEADAKEILRILISIVKSKEN